ncbi:MAG TPA: hypothetical protein VFM96_01405 [Gaiellaceae bacterium]|nr:hypothetical protein [Gaiellaceae bacterium]
MRVTLAIAAAALALASTAHANNPPLAPMKPATLSGLRVVIFGNRAQLSKRLTSCHASQVAPRGVVGRAARKLLPVACEQPPRTQLAIIVFAGG